jgi:hypothetical protein
MKLRPVATEDNTGSLVYDYMLIHSVSRFC